MGEKTTFEALGIQENILEGLTALGFEYPTPIQEKAIPLLLEDRPDIIASAQTGTGKTAAFGIPVISYVSLSEKFPQALILSPTRELCIQIARDLQAYSKFVNGLSILPVYGGSNIDQQIKALNKGVHIVVGTPGRTHDLIRRKKLQLNQVQTVVLDEADEMLTMGFKDDLDAILSKTPEDKQTLLFSATMSKEVLAITRNYMDDPQQIAVAKQNKGAETVQHQFYLVQVSQKYELLKRIADINPNIYGIVFCRTRRESKDIADKLMQDGYNADALHGDLSQAQRDYVMKRFRNGNLQILVATDVAARGIDVNDITHVINYGVPDDPEVYVHRSGRTGRAGRTGISLAIIPKKDMRKLKTIEKKAHIKFEQAELPKGRDICEKQLLALVDRIVDTEVDEEEISDFLPAILEKFSELDREELVKKVVSVEFNKFLDYYKDRSDLKDHGSRRDDRDSRGQNSPNFSRMYLNVGVKDGMEPHRLIGVVNDILDHANAAIGQIEILKKFSFFEIESKFVDELVQKVGGHSFQGKSLLVEETKTPKRAAKFKGKRRSNNNPRAGRGRGNRGSKFKRRR